jgi:hypothetical protein
MMGRFIIDLSTNGLDFLTVAILKCLTPFEDRQGKN